MSRKVEGCAGPVQPISAHDTSYKPGKIKRIKPHYKTTIIGASLKTRLHCNHLIPKCKCSAKSNRKKSHKTKQVVQEVGIQRTVLSSSRALPRGEMNGRKIYQSTDDSVSICDATWRPNLSNSSKTNNENHNHKFRKGDERVLKKKLRFEDQVTELNESYNPAQMTHSAKKINTNKSQKQNDIQPSSSIQVPYTHYRANSNTHLWTKTSGNYCRLCEAPDKGCFDKANRIKKTDQGHKNHSENTTLKYHPEHDEFSSHNELCFLCHRFRNNKYDDNYCKICNTHLCYSQEGMTESEHSLHHRGSPSAQAGGGKNNTKIPYEPRTKFVKKLKEKLETAYMKDELKVSCLLNVSFVLGVVE